ncbi:F-box domain [Arabidopsis thaliana x Arabidopsis arenosa]|uniref:F-box domain n=1 Tax=Arabidopsis thaliana x Arabidopsis arenosa TaxID=1240361 RepID=A0A8T2C3K9_9BRAS|nr:F-box domain [Arabidopsis thaliana x Arabidopsis arenosa]
MTKRKQHVSGDNSLFDQISVDLVINILSKLPVKSIAQCRCVSKHWSSIIRRPNYNMLFPTKSPATPRFLFIVRNGLFGPNLFISSSPQPQNPDKYLSLEATLHSLTATDYFKICPPVNGLVCRYLRGNGCIFAVISNPITGEYVTTPKVKTEDYPSKEKMYFGYDPVEEQFKVLFMTWLPSSGSHDYQVLTLGTRNLSWRKIQCCVLHYPHEDDGICINGLLYYQAIIDQKRSIVCFDVRSEKFSFVNIDQYLATRIREPLILMNYKGSKLGAIHCHIESNFFNLWVLENAEEHKWSDNFYKMPEVLRPSRIESLFSAGMIGSGEVVLYGKNARIFVYILYYNLEKNIITSVSFLVPGLDYVEYHGVHTFPNFVGDVKLM